MTKTQNEIYKMHCSQHAGRRFETNKFILLSVTSSAAVRDVSLKVAMMPLLIDIFGSLAAQLNAIMLPARAVSDPTGNVMI